eukprot:TRINITY_DN78571_c0_g1_i1.p1 TRINITY_DN78571_c0_g1~~TRINITY_DN78571_c0_g1_i1.p1  ORF type:complete len:103 (-),score=5.02 TRINITY_DN78571_c0_g1_i1:94-402(-)
MGTQKHHSSVLIASHHSNKQKTTGMSFAVYSKIWEGTRGYTARRNYGYFQMWNRFYPWWPCVGIIGCWFAFNILETPYKRLVTFGLYTPNRVDGYGRISWYD